MDVQDKFERAQTILGHVFEEPRWLVEALQAPGSSTRRYAGHWLFDGNKPLAGIGDRVATLVLTLEHYKKGDSTGTTNYAISAKLNNNRLAQLCDENDLTSCIGLNVGHCGAIGNRTKSDTIEAIIGAGYQEGGLELARQFMLTLGII